MHRVAILKVDNTFTAHAADPDGCYHFGIYYKLLKRGRKRMRWFYVVARDEMEAFTNAREQLRKQGYKV